MKHTLLCLMVLAAYLLPSSLAEHVTAGEQQKRRARAQAHQDHDQHDEDEHEDHDERVAIEELEERLNEWAEDHARSWEKWASKFESKMEKWAQETEEELDVWAEKYAKQWENWSKQIEEGLDEKQIGNLLKKNMEMIGKLPIGSVTERLQSLGNEIEEMPLESLGELGELLAGSIELSLNEFEHALDRDELNAKLKEAQEESNDVLRAVLDQLHTSLDARQKHHKRDADKRIIELDELIGSRKKVNLQEIEKLVKQYQEKRTNRAQQDQDRAKAIMLEQRKMLEQLQAKKAFMKDALKERYEKYKMLDKDERKAVERELEASVKQVQSAMEGIVAKEAAIRQALDLQMSKQAREDANQRRQQEKKLAVEKMMELHKLQQREMAEQQRKVAEQQRRVAEDAEKIAKAIKLEEEKRNEKFRRAWENARKKQEAANEKVIAAAKEEAAKAELVKRAAMEAELARKAANRESQKLKDVYRELLERTKRIEAKESELDAMRAEIESLRKELQQLRKKKDRD